MPPTIHSGRTGTDTLHLRVGEEHMPTAIPLSSDFGDSSTECHNGTEERQQRKNTATAELQQNRQQGCNREAAEPQQRAKERQQTRKWEQVNASLARRQAGLYYA